MPVATAVGAVPALGGAVTAHAASTSSDTPADAQKARAATPAKSTSTGKHGKHYASVPETPAPGSETDVPASVKPAQPYMPGSETDVPATAKPAMTATQERTWS